MGSYTFTWSHPANEVLVAGSFTNWQPTVKLDKSGSAHEKTVDIPETSEKILYKFVADGEWKHDHTGKTETDHEGNVNNVLYPSDIKPHSAAQSLISSVAPGASTTAMAGKQPVETPAVEDIPGAFPETPAAGFEEKKEEQAFGVNPIPASAGAGNPIQLAPGEKVPHPSTINSNTLTSAVHDDPSLKSNQTEQTFGIAPIPASGGIGNPIHLQPGQNVPEPSSITSNTIGSNVKLDQASYERSDAGAPILPPVLTPQGEKEARGEAAIFAGLGPQTTNMIPESSLGMGKDVPASLDGPSISSVGAASTTNQLAGQVPKEPRGVPEVVSDSQQVAHASPEASANPNAVVEKSQVENELKAKVPEEQATNENTGGVIGAAFGGLAALGTAAAGTAYALQSKATEAVQSQTESSPSASQYVPEVVKDSQREAHAAPEASANPIAVQEKSGVESELKAKVPEESATSSSGLSAGGIVGAVTGGFAAAGTAAAGAAYALSNKATGSVQPIQAQGEAGAVPEVVKDSQKEAHASPEASANPHAVEEKAAMEGELKSMVPKEKATTDSSILGAVTGGIAGAGAAAAGATLALNAKAKDSTGTDAVSKLPEGVQSTIHQSAKESELTPQNATHPSGVPTEVTESQKEAHVAPEASANPEAVSEKSAAEKELLSKVPTTQATGAPAPAVTAATSAIAPNASTTTSTTAPTTSGTAQHDPMHLGGATGVVPSSSVPPVTASSATGAPQLANPVGGIAPINMDKELNAPAGSQAQTPATRANELTASRDADSRDVSPMSKPVTGAHSQPTATTGVDSATIPSQSKPVGTPRTGATNSTPTKRNSIMERFKGTPESSKETSATPGSEGKKKGFFSKIKEKLNKH